MEKVLYLLQGLVVLLLAFHEVTADRIVGGIDAAPGQFPYMVSLRNLKFNTSYNHFCGGSILTNRTILTAAHCLMPGSSTADHEIYVGSNLLSGGGTTYKVAGFIRHPDYNAQGSLSHDTAVVYLEKDLEYSSLVQPIELDREYVGGGYSTILSGWGYINFDDDIGGGEIPNKLQYLDTHTLTNPDCVEKLPPGYPVPGVSHICFHTVSGEGACGGDSGSPFVRNGKQIGIISWSGTYCAKGFPDGAARISTDYNWIRSVTIPRPE